MFLPSNITLQFGDSGDFVTELQRRLALVHSFAGDQVNGFFDGNTVNAVTRFQAMVGVHADGVAGPETLRRLNGVISGASDSAPSGNQEEEKKTESSASILDELLAPAPAAIDTAFIAATVHPEQAHAEEKLPAAPTQPQPPEQLTQPPRPPLEERRALEPPLPADRFFAEQFLHPAPKPDAAAQAHAPHHETPQAQHPQPKQPEQPLPHHQQQADAAKHAEPVAEKPAEAPAKQGIIGRTVERATQFASSVMQKLSSYFESKLPPSVLDEVKQIGQTMLNHGMRETPVPTGPEMLSPGQTPAHGAPAPERGGQRG